MKKGFVFIETVTVLMVLVTAVLSTFLAFQGIKANIDKRENFDNISDIYKTDIIRKMVVPDLINEATGNYIKITEANCTSYMNNACTALLNDLEVKYIFINLVKVSEIDDADFSNTMREYLKTIETSKANNLGRDEELFKRLIIVNFDHRGSNYYASLDI